MSSVEKMTLLRASTDGPIFRQQTWRVITQQRRWCSCQRAKMAISWAEQMALLVEIKDCTILRTDQPKLVKIPLYVQVALFVKKKKNVIPQTGHYGEYQNDTNMRDHVLQVQSHRSGQSRLHTLRFHAFITNSSSKPWMLRIFTPTLNPFSKSSKQHRCLACTALDDDGFLM